MGGGDASGGQRVLAGGAPQPDRALLSGSVRPHLSGLLARHTLRPEAWLVVAGAATVLVVALAYWRIWDGGLQGPLVYSGDALLYQRLAKTVVERGWYLSNPLIGAPGGQVLHDYPLGADNLHFVTFRLLALFTSNPLAVVNGFYYLSFPLVFATACYAFRRLGFAFLLAVPLAVVYALAPYHFSRNTVHLFLSAYYAVPLACLLLYELLAQAEPAEEEEGTGEQTVRTADPPLRQLLRTRRFWRSRWLWIPVVLATTGAYYALFFVVLAAGVGLATALFRRQLSLLARPAVAIGLTLAVLFVNNLPSVVHRLANGPNPEVARRDLGEADINALQWSATLLPLQQHRVEALGRFRQRANETISPIPPSGQEALGALAAAGFVIAVGSLLVEGGRRGRWSKLRRHSGAVNVLAVLLGSVGGAASLLGLFGFLQLRAYERLVVFTGFCSLVALGAGLAAVLEKRPQPSGRRWGVAGLVAVVGAGALAWADHTPRGGVGRAFFAQDADADRQLAKSIQRRMGPQAMVLQVPLVGFPEDVVRLPVRPLPLHLVSGGTEVYNGYELFRPTLFTDRVRWSYGRIQGRPGDVLPALRGKPLDVLLPEAVAAGFTGVYIDRTAFPDFAGQLEAELAERVGPPALESGNDLRSFFDLRPYAERWRATTPPGVAAEVRRRATSPLDLVWGDGFSEVDGIGRFFPQIPGFTAGRWGDHGAVLEVANATGQSRVLTLHASARSSTGAPTLLTLRAGARMSSPEVIDANPRDVTLRIEVAAGTTRVAFQTATAGPPQPATPGAPGNPGFRLDDVWWEG